MLSFFDSHCHFDFSDFDEDRHSLWQQCLQSGINQLLIPGTYPEQWLTAADLSQKHEGIFTAAGIHPWWVNDVKTISEPLLQSWHKTLSDPQCVAIGECGLDKAISTDLGLQQRFFEQHLTLAVECQLPLIIHVRKSHNETLKLLKQYQPKAGGVIHGFSGSIELAQQYWQMGFYLGIGGTITYPRANKTRESVKQLPLEALVLETDAPDMPLAGFQGERNSPLQLLTIAKTLANLRNEPLSHIAQTTTHNAQHLFSL